MRIGILFVLAGSTACYRVEPGSSPLCGHGALVEALAGAAPGDVVRVGACEVEGALVVPAGVTLEGEGADVSVLVGPADGVAVTLSPGAAESAVRTLRVRARGCAGVLARGAGEVLVEDVEVDVERGLGLGLEGGVAGRVHGVCVRGPVTLANADEWPADSEIATAGLVIADASAEVADFEATGFGLAGAMFLDSSVRWAGGSIEGNLGVGLFASGGELLLHGVEVADTLQGSRLAPPIGVVVRDGASIDATRLTVRRSEGLGLLAVGASGRLADVVAEGNAEVGLWIWGATSFAVEGGHVADNALAGVVIQSSRGVTLRDLAVERTHFATVISELGAVEVADGVEIAGPGSEVTLERVVLRDNPRAGAVADLEGGDGTGIAFVDVSVAGDALGVVVQDGRPSAGWDQGVDRAGATAANDAAFAARGDALFLPATGPAPEDPPSGPHPPLCGP